jgi:TrpR-related protein YerC/YecD
MIKKLATTKKSKQIFENLAQALTSLNTLQEAKAFLSDILTKKEIDEISKRLEAAKMLYTGVSYAEIASKLGLSSTTVARISRCLHGSARGYKTLIEKEGILQKLQKTN